MAARARWRSTRAGQASGALTPVHVFSRDPGVGHHREYNEALGRELLTLGFASRFVDRLAPMLACRRVLFPMVEAAPAMFLFSAIVSLFSGGRTVGLLFRPAECFRAGFKHRVKYALFRLLIRVPSVRVLTILPFSVQPRFAEIADDWIYDPQLWDALTLDELAPVETPLSGEAQAFAAGRRLIVALGVQNRGKGLDWLRDIWASDAALRDSYGLVIAGPVAIDRRAGIEELRQSGALVVDRRLTTEELRSLYGSASLIWAGYHPDYDQASGIAGRAFQFGTPLVVRQGSLVARLMRDLGHSALEIEYGDPAHAAACLLAWRGAARTKSPPESTLDPMRTRSLRVLAAALGAPPDFASSPHPARTP